MIYRTICTQLWTDKKIHQLTVQGKLLFVYLITNPHTHLSGIYYLPTELITKETGLSNTLSNTLFHTLSELERAYYDAETSTVFVVNMFSYQGTGEKNERSAANQLTGLHETPLIGRFLERYPRVRSFCADTLLDTVSTLSKRCPSVPDPVSSSLECPNPKKERESEREKTNGRDYRDEAKVLLAFLNEKTQKKFREVPANLTLIEARLKSGVDLQTCRTLIMRKIHDWKDKPEMHAYLRPETLFGKLKFESYLAEVTR